MVIQLHFVEELNLAKIAEVLVVSVPRVRQLKARALNKLRTALGEDGLSDSRNSKVDS